MAGKISNTSRSRPVNFVSHIPSGDLKAIRVTFQRNISVSGPSGPVERDLDDPKLLIPLVHKRKDPRQWPTSIFDREDVLVNQEEKFEHANKLSLDYRRSRSRSLRSRSRSSSAEKRKVSTKNGNKISSDCRRSPEKDHKSRAYSREREHEKYRKRSRTPLRPGEYRPSYSDVKYGSSSRDGENSWEKSRTHSRRSRSRSPDYSKPSTSTRSPRRSLSRSRDGDRRRSRSPRYVESSKSRGSPSKYDRYSSKRRSRSPRHDSRRSSSDRRRSPHPPIVTFSKSRGSDHKHRSRSPSYERDKKYYRRSRSRSPRKHGGRPSPLPKDPGYVYYEGAHFPGAPIHPGFAPVYPPYAAPLFPRMAGPPIYGPPPRIPMMQYPPGPYPPGFRPRLPVYNTKYAQKPTITVLPAGDRTVSTTGGNERKPNPEANEERGEIIQDVTEKTVVDKIVSDNEAEITLHEKD